MLYNNSCFIYPLSEMNKIMVLLTTPSCWSWAISRCTPASSSRRLSPNSPRRDFPTQSLELNWGWCTWGVLVQIFLFSFTLIASLKLFPPKKFKLLHSITFIIFRISLRKTTSKASYVKNKIELSIYGLHECSRPKQIFPFVFFPCILALLNIATASLHFHSFVHLF